MASLFVWPCTFYIFSQQLLSPETLFSSLFPWSWTRWRWKAMVSIVLSLALSNGKDNLYTECKMAFIPLLDRHINVIVTPLYVFTNVSNYILTRSCSRFYRLQEKNSFYIAWRTTLSPVAESNSHFCLSIKKGFLTV